MHDLVIRGANLIDGLGNPAKHADVAVKDGRVTGIAPAGSIKEDSARTVDADGKTLAPGIVDMAVFVP